VWLLALALLTVGPPAVLGQSAAPAAPEFADWTALSDGNTVLTGTLLGQPIRISGGAFHPNGPIDGSSTIFAGPAFSPPLAMSDAPELTGTNPASTYTITFGAPVRNPILHLSSLASVLTFPAATRISKLSGDSRLVVSDNTVSGSFPDVAGSVQFAGDFETLSFTALWTGSAQPDGVDFAVGAIRVPPVAVSPTPTPTPVAPTSTTPAPPIAGVRVVAELASGQVLVRLPSSQDFVPLRGAASVPVGAVVDARKGSLEFRSAADGGGRVESATLAAGIFQIRQARAKGLAPAPTEFVLVTPAGLERACAASRTRPAKGIVRTLSVTAKGLFRTVGKKGVVTGRNAAWSTSDRCDGTLTTVRRGSVSVRAARRTVRVRAGHRYLIKAQLFAAKRK
jgi:hypothetical protein